MKALHVITVLIIPLVSWLVGCSQPPDPYTSPKGYNLKAPEKWLLPGSLNEVSGIAFNNGDPGLLYTQQDEDGNIYYLKPGDDKASKSKFGKKGDYEDIAIANATVIILRSDGSLYTFNLTETTKDAIPDVKEWKGLVPKEEYEGLYTDPSGKAIYLLCKQCNSDSSGKSAMGYILQRDASGNILPGSKFSSTLPESAFPDTKKPTPFRPSALARHPLTGEWYILSSVNSMLVVANPDWQVQAVHRLSHSLFNQPEGIAFDSSGNLYISNEGGKKTNPNVLKFTFTKDK